MNKQELIKTGIQLLENSENNRIKDKADIPEQMVGMRIFEKPVFAFGAADDDYFVTFKDPSIIGGHYLLPVEWLPGAKTVISYFLPFSRGIREANAKEKYWPSAEWLHGFADGQAFLNQLGRHLKLELTKAGYNSLVPSLEERFWARTGINDSLPSELLYTSNWSERHAAFVCGLGTFGLSKGLITSKGLAGRFGSIITEMYLSPDRREYQNVDEYCSKCGKCVKNCPVNAISLEEGKNHSICSKFLGQTLEKYRPRYGCGKCQINVPCESKIPQKNNEHGL